MGKSKQNQSELRKIDELHDRFWDLVMDYDPYTFFIVSSHFCAMAAVYSGIEKWDAVKEFEIVFDEEEAQVDELAEQDEQPPTEH
jgi:hypothetical protein